MKIPEFDVCLRRARLAAGYATKQALIDRVEVHRQTYTAMENGVRPNPAWRYVYKIIVAGNLPLEEFFPERCILDAADRIASSNGDKS